MVEVALRLFIGECSVVVVLIGLSISGGKVSWGWLMIGVCVKGRRDVGMLVAAISFTNTYQQRTEYLENEKILILVSFYFLKYIKLFQLFPNPYKKVTGSLSVYLYLRILLMILFYTLASGKV